MHRYLIPVLLALVTFSFPVFAQEPPMKIGFVDRQAIFDTPRVVRIIDELQEKAQAAEDQMKAMELELEEMTRRYESLREMGLSETSDERQRREIREKQQAIMDFGRNQLAHLREEQAEKEWEITEEIREIVAQLAEEHGYTLILWESAVAYGSVEYDMTLEVLERFNIGQEGSQ